MLTLKLRKIGNSYVVTIPREELKRHNLREGDMVGIEIRKLKVTPEMLPELRAAFYQTVKTFRADIKYLTGKQISGQSLVGDKYIDLSCLPYNDTVI